MKEILFLILYVLGGISLALFMHNDFEELDDRENYSFYVFVGALWPVLVLVVVIVGIVDWLNQHIGGGPSMFA